jgi:phosphoribosylformylglycinamidine cyclo-ligase
LIGVPSSGLHTNGYSLARHVLFEKSGLAPASHLSELGGTVGDALLATHKSYLSAVTPLLERGYVKGLAHITGGGITENLPRTLPEGCAAEVDLAAWRVPPIFRLIQERGGVVLDEMLRAFNMGIGLVVVCGANDAERVLNVLSTHGEPNAVRLGSIVAGTREVRYR